MCAYIPNIMEVCFSTSNSDIIPRNEGWEKHPQHMITSWVNCLSCWGHLVPCYGAWVRLCLGTASWNSTLARLCSPMSSFSLSDAVAESEHCRVTQLPTTHVSVVCPTRCWRRSQRCDMPVTWRESWFWRCQEAPWLPWCLVVLCHLLMWFLSCWPAS